ncbi:MAG: MATE family efflux transporter [Chitinivibrionales bacterium]|nr:MATE family efflux transporter [Chitinivibrionales bacterium]MBD3357252.1 MATE family efflux transporter [Chitinivibrionales bacterium]
MQQNPTKSYLDILKLSGPLILTMSGMMLMQFLDALFLSWHSSDAIAAVVPAGMVAWLVVSALHGTAGYVATLVAQYTGAKKPELTAIVVWQGVYFAVASGLIVGSLSLLAEPLFAWAGHEPSVQAMEVSYFRILCLGASIEVTAVALSGFFAGREDTRTVMLVHLCGFAANAVLNYVLIFGHFGMPRLGITGAALGTVAAHAVVATLFAVLFFTRTNRERFGTWRNRAVHVDMLKRLIRFGMPRGIAWTIEMTAWTAFLFIVGRLGTVELAATNIAWRLNGFAFFPIVGLAQAVGILVGNAQGARAPETSARITWKGLVASELWMVFASLIFVLFPEWLYSLFQGRGTVDPNSFAHISKTGTILLRFVALYSLLDAFNIVFITSLQSAGDTRFTVITTAVAHALFLGSLVVGDRLGIGLIGEWIIVTTFVMLQGLMWMARFLSGKWKTIEVVGREALG